MTTSPDPYEALRAAGWRQTETVGYANMLGPFWTLGPDRYAFLAQERHLNRRGHVHGGMLLSFADQHLLALARSAEPGLSTATIDLNMHFIAAGHLGDLIELRPRTVRRSQSLLFVDGDLSVGGEIIATAKGIWKIFRPAVTVTV